MNPTNLNDIIRNGEEVLQFLSRKDSVSEINPQKTKSAYDHMFPKRNNTEYTYLKDSIHSMRKFLQDVLTNKEVQRLFDSLNPTTQSQVRNFVSDYGIFELIDINENPDDFTKYGGSYTQELPNGEKKIHKLKGSLEKHSDIQSQISHLSPKEQIMLWESRVIGYIWYEASRLLLRNFIRRIVALYENIENISTQKKLVFNQNGTIIINGDQLKELLKPGTRNYKFFDILYQNIDKRVSNEEIIKYLGVLNGSKTVGSNLSDIKGRMPKEIKDLISPVMNGYILDTSKL